MRWMFPLLLFLSLPLLLAAPARAQYPWSGILDPSRATDWSQAGIPGGIPNYTTVCQTVTLSTGSGNAAANTTAINNALSSCNGKGQVVALPSGTYYVNGISFPQPATREILRGQGPDKTVLLFSARITPCEDSAAGADVCMDGNVNYAAAYTASTTWTGDNGIAGSYAKGDTVIDVASTTGLCAAGGSTQVCASLGQSGNIIILDQRNDSVGITAESESGTTATITTSIPHGFSVGQAVMVDPETNNGGWTSSGYEGTWTITDVGCMVSGTYATFANCASNPLNAFQYTNPTTGLASNSGNRDFAGVDTGGAFNCDLVTGCNLSNANYLGRLCPDTKNPACQTGEISGRAQEEVKQITAINGHQLTITPPIEHSNWRTSQAPGIWWTGVYSQLIGIEGVTVDYTNDGGYVGATPGIGWNACYECWAKNIRSINANAQHFLIAYSARDEVVDSYLYGTKRGASESYGVDAIVDDSDLLIQNNICQRVVACQMEEGDSGSVWAYNYEQDPGYSNPDWFMYTFSPNHGFSAYSLTEGNDVGGVDLDDWHGSSVATTFFRNRLRGQDTPAMGEDRFAVADKAYNRAANFIGNILGTVGQEATYQDTTTVGGNTGSGTVFVGIGTSAGNMSPNVAYDPLTTNSLLRWGNYDVVTGAVRWCGNSTDPGWSTICSGTSEVPTTGITYINGNPVPSSTTLPPSFYLSAQPPWWQTAWGTPTWPAIGPEVTGGTAPDGAAGHSYAIPAQLCYQNTAIDPNYQQSFTVTAATVARGYWPYNVTLTIGTNSVPAWSTITVSGASPSTFNGTFQVVASTSTTVTYGMQTNPGTYSSGGTVTWPNMLLYNAAACYPAAYNLPNPVTLTATPH